MNIDSLDHLVLTVADVNTSVDFYCRIMGMQAIKFSDDCHNLRFALKFGEQKINLHQRGAEFKPNAQVATAGSADLCFLSQTPIEKIVTSLQGFGIDIIDGPVLRTGATGPLQSVYFRDPDGNLIEVSNLLQPGFDPDAVACP